MRPQLTLEYWRDGDWHVGRLLEVPGVFSQGESLDELRENVQDAYELMVTQDRAPAPTAAQQQDLELEVCPACGYDLRATPDRCPECGAVPAGKAAA